MMATWWFNMSLEDRYDAPLIESMILGAYLIIEFGLSSVISHKFDQNRN